MRSKITIIPNEEQEKVINAQDGNYVVISGPGSGKTFCLCQRYLRMMIGGVSQSDMLNLTFTHAAAEEMSTRAGILNAKQVFRTFHSFALELLKNERDKLPFDVCETIIPVELQDYQLLFDLVKVYPALVWRTLQEKIGLWKCNAVLPDQAIEEARHNGIEYFYALAYKDYEDRSRLHLEGLVMLR